MDQEEKKGIGWSLKKEAMGHLFSCLSPEDGYKVSEDGIMIFYYRYLIYKAARTLEDLALLFMYAVLIVLTAHVLLTIEAQKPLIIAVFIGQAIFIKRVRRLRTLEYSIGVGRMIASVMQKFPEEFVPEEEKEDTSNGE